MSFINPMIAWIGLAAVALPIIIHIIMRRRRRPVSWGAMRFLEQALKRQRRRTRLEQLLLLAARCLLVALIALALGRPMFGDPNSIGMDAPRTLYLVIDDSLTSDLRSGGKRALDRHLEAAMRSIDELSDARGDSVAIVTLARPSQSLIMPPTGDLTAAKNTLSRIIAKDSRADFVSAIETIAKDRGDRSERFAIEMLSDFRAGSFVPAQAAPRAKALSFADVTVSPVATDLPGNVRLKSIRVLQPPIMRGSDRISLPVRIQAMRDTREGSLSAERTVVNVSLASLDRLDEPKATSTVELSWLEGRAEAAATVFLQVDSQAIAETSDVVISATISGDALDRDNTVRCSARAWKRVEVAIIAPGADSTDDPGRFSPAQWLSLSLAPESEESERRRLESDLRVISIDPSRSSQPAALSKVRALLIPSPERIDGAGWNQISSAAQAGVFVLISPPKEPVAQTWADTLTASGWAFSVAREVRLHEPPLKLAVTASGASSEGPLGLLGSELEELIKPVSVSRSVMLSGPSDSFDSLLSMSDGSPFLAIARRTDGARGAIAILASAPDTDWTDLPAKPLMLPLIQELIRQGIGAAGTGLTAVAGERPKLPAGAVELREVGGSRAYSASDETPALHDAGVFVARDGSGGSIDVSVINPAFEAGDTALNDAAKVSEWIDASGATVRASNGEHVQQATNSRDAGWSVPLLAMALVLAAIEAFMARSFSHATMERAA